MTNNIEIATASRRAIVPVSCFIRAFRRTTRTVAGQAVLEMLHSWGTAGAASAFAKLSSAASETLSLAGRNDAGAP